MNAAYRLLSRRDHSTEELRSKLKSRSFTPEEIDGAIEKLKSAGLLNDDQFAAGFVRYCQTYRRLGLFRIKRELAVKGIKGEAATEALKHYSEEAAEENLDHLISRKIEKGDSRNTVYNYLMHRGYDSDSIRKVLPAFPNEVSGGMKTRNC